MNEELVKILEIPLFHPVTDEVINERRKYYNEFFKNFKIDPKFKIEDNKKIFLVGRKKCEIPTLSFCVYVFKSDVSLAQEILREFEESTEFEAHDELDNG